MTSPAGWASVAATRGFLCFLAVAGIGQVLALAVWAVADTGASFWAFSRIGWIYVGAFHHVAVEIDVVDIDLPGTTALGSASSSIGVALLAVTAIALWLLFRAGGSVADRAGGSLRSRVLSGAAVAPTYAIPVFLLALLVDVRTPLRFGSFATGELGVALSPWQGLLFPLALAAVAGAAGGLRSALEHDPDRRKTLSVTAGALVGGWRMFWVALVLSFAGLFVAGVVQPDGPEALLTPSTARYLRGVFDRPVAGVVVLAHHLAVAPNEATWALVPAMGACDVVRATDREDVLCYGRFPSSVATTALPIGGGNVVAVPTGEATFERAPTGYLFFLLVPLIATVLGGRYVAGRSDGRRQAAIAATAAGVVYAVLVAAAALLSTITVDLEAETEGEVVSARSFTAGPDVASGALLALVWGVAGGLLGVASAGAPSSVRSRPTGR